MGNCLRHESSMQRGVDDRRSPVPNRLFTSNSHLYRNTKGMSSSTTTANITATSSSTEVKIRITKKQLEELLGRVDMKQLSMEEVLALFIKVGGDGFESHRRCWRPNLQSIPE